MSKRTLFSLGTCLLIAGVVLAFVGTGGAASKNICTTPSNLTQNPPVNASCVGQLVLSHFISTASNPSDPTTWSQAISTTKFTNQAGAGGATATHTVVGVTFTARPPLASSFVTILQTTAFANGVQITNPTCTTTTTNDPTQPGYDSTKSSTVTRACSFDSVPGGSTAKVNVRFATNTSMNTPATLITGTATYGESGNDNTGGPNGTTNDSESSQDFLTVGSGTIQGNCFTTSSATISGSTTNQKTTANVGQAANLPCTPLDAGVDPSAQLPSSFTQQEAFVEFPALSGGAFGTVILDFFNVKNANQFTLFELTNPAKPTLASSWTKVGNCGTATTLDSCIASTGQVPGKVSGTEYVLHVFGSDFDAKFGG